jgi:hypothetical protein
MNLILGTRLRSSVCSTEMIVVKAADHQVQVSCGGAPMLEAGSAGGLTGDPDPTYAQGTHLGKRYFHRSSGLELLCVKAGRGSLSVDGDSFEVKSAQPLPSSD